MPVKTFGFDEFGRKLDLVAYFVSTSKTPLLKSGDWLLSDTKANFNKGGALFQVGGWKPLTKATKQDKERKGYGGKPKMVRTGQLKSKFYKRVGNGKVELYNARDHFKYHQLGGTKIPKRTMLGIRKEAVTAVTQIFESSINTLFKSFFK